MKILLANKFYYPRGGDCIYTIELEKLLRDQGHEVAVFSMRHPSNLATEYSVYFPGHVDFNKRNLKSLISLLVRPFGSSEVRRKFKRLVADFNPDIIHLNNIHSQLSPAIALICYRNHIPVVWTLHDYKLVCPAYLLLSHGEKCEACLKNKWSVVSKKCIKNNIFASLVAHWEAIYWNPGKINKITDRFISPSNFLKKEMVKGGIDEKKIEVLHNFINTRDFSIGARVEDYYCYVGRLSAEKGIEGLLKAASSLPSFKLKIIGTGPLEERLAANGYGQNVEFLGYRSGDDLRTIIAESKFLVLPSDWYENNPLSVLEALILGVPVIGADIGGIPELIKSGFNGILFEAGNIVDLKEKIRYLWQNQDRFNRSEIAARAAKEFSSVVYYRSLMDLYNSLVDNKKSNVEI